jgi:MOSC domain-containing protein YiiM
VNVGLPQEIEWRGHMVSTGIFKRPVRGRVAVRRLNVEGDRQADLSVHGGPDKAIYAYPAEHYAYWRAELPDMELPWAQFGENLTTEGLRDDEVQIGDRFRAGSAEVVVTQPRLPCYKLGIRFGCPDMVRWFLKSGRTGFYFAVEREGEVAAGDPIIPLQRATHGVTVADITRLYSRGRGGLDTLRRVVALEALPASWRDYFRRQIDEQARSAGQRAARRPSGG